MFGIIRDKKAARHQEREAADQQAYGLSGSFGFVNQHSGGALSLSAIFCAVEMISNSLAVLPISSTDGDRTAAIFSGNLQGKYNLVKSLVSDMLLYGNGFAYIQRGRDGRPTGLRYLQPTDVTIHWNKEDQALDYWCSVCGGKVYPQDMIHIYKNSRDGYTGIGVLQFASRTIQLANYTEDAAVDYYKDGLNTTGILHAKAPMRKDQAQQALRSVEGNIGGGSGRIKFVPFDLEFNTLSESAKDAALVESRLYNITEVARYFCISPTLLQDLSHSGYSSIEAANVQYLTHTIIPYVYILETELNRKLVPEGDVRINLDETALLRTDAKSTAEYYQGLVNNAIMTVNEARQALGYDPVEGGDTLVKAYTKVQDNIVGGDAKQEDPEPDVEPEAAE